MVVNENSTNISLLRWVTVFAVTLFSAPICSLGFAITILIPLGDGDLGEAIGWLFTILAPTAGVIGSSLAQYFCLRKYIKSASIWFSTSSSLAIISTIFGSMLAVVLNNTVYSLGERFGIEVKANLVHWLAFLGPIGLGVGIGQYLILKKELQRTQVLIFINTITWFLWAGAIFWQSCIGGSYLCR